MQVTEVIVLEDRLSSGQIKKFGPVAIVFEFSGFYRSIVTFLGLFIVFVSVLSILFFFRPKFPEK